MFRFSWTCTEENGLFVVSAPGADRIEYELDGGPTGAVDGETLHIMKAPNTTWIKLHRGTESTNWICLKTGIAEVLATALARTHFELGS
jgi:hypothetical protein